MEKCLVVKEVVFENFDEKNRSYQCVLSFFSGDKARLFCKENQDTKKMYPIYVGIMNGTCPCCKKPNCASLESKKGMLFEQVLQLKPEAEEFETANPLALSTR